jgi:hypothetical protein
MCHKGRTSNPVLCSSAWENMIHKAAATEQFGSAEAPHETVRRHTLACFTDGSSFMARMMRM